MICQSCSTLNRDDAKFCKGCGRALHAQQVNTANAPVVAAPASPASPAIVEPMPQEDDFALAPTLIMSPEMLAAMQERRKGADAPRVEAGVHSGSSSSAYDGKWSDAPAGLAAPASPALERSAADLPTVLMSPAQDGDLQPVPPPPPPPPSSFAAPDMSVDVPGQSDDAQDESPYEMDRAGYPEVEENVAMQPMQQPQEQAATQPYMEQAGQEVREPETEQPVQAPGSGQAGADAQPQAEQAAIPASTVSTDAFPTLAVGALLAGRYEVSQVLSEQEQEHVYQVIDHQGFHRCWSCGSEHNVEGDDFCIECGASLSGVPYMLHEYSAQQNTEDAPVLQGNIVDTFVDQGRTYAVAQVQAEQSAFANGVYLQAAVASDAGNVRRSDPNEDSALVLQLQRVHESMSAPLGVYIVADGMGGHDYGQVASRVAINVIAETLTKALLLDPLSAERNGEAVKPLDEDTLVALLHGAVADANNVLCQKNAQDKTDMGSTLTGFLIAGDHAYIVNVGDSRTYMLRNKQIYQLTTDHSLVGQLVASGLIEPDDVYTHPQRSQIFRSLGDKPSLQIDIFKQQLLPGDVLLSCCDGLWEMVRNPQIESILNTAPDPQTACIQLVDAANTNGGEDNITSIVVTVR